MKFYEVKMVKLTYDRGLFNGYETLGYYANKETAEKVAAAVKPGMPKLLSMRWSSIKYTEARLSFPFFAFRCKRLHGTDIVVYIFRQNAQKNNVVSSPECTKVLLLEARLF